MNNLIKKAIPALFLASIATVSFATNNESFHSQISSSVFGDAARHFSIDPYLLYSIALVESSHGAGNRLVAPYPYALRSAQLGAEYPATKQEAEIALVNHLSNARKLHSVDVCLMQVNLGWNGHRVKNPSDLLDLKTCVFTGAAILKDALASTQNLYQAIGRYHTWQDQEAGQKYALRVVRIYNKLPRT